MAFFTPKCPVEEKTKTWVEDSFVWFAERFGEESIRESEVILPTDEAFPERIFADDQTLNVFLKAVCGFMKVDYSSISLKVFADTGQKNFFPLATPDSKGSKACGLYYFYARKNQIAIDQNLLKTPAALVATMAHQLAHARLTDVQVPDNLRGSEELLTDLATIFFGMGIFTANSIFGFNQFATVQYQGWRATRTGYIDEQTAGYALALFAYMKGDNKPGWAKFLETNPKHYLKQSIKYLLKTGDTKVKGVDRVN